MANRADRMTDALLENPISFPGGHLYERLQPITDFRKDPNEARILYLCRAIKNDPSIPNGVDQDEGGEEYVVKIKVQVPPLSPEHQQTPLPGPSEYTAAELQALAVFKVHKLASVPHLVTSKCAKQDANGVFPDGYISYTVMTKMPGRDLMSLGFWSMPEEQRQEIRQAFLKELKSIWRLGFAPYDCALRNVLWDPEIRRCSIVDFEHWHDARDPINMNETEEMQRWGLMHRPPPATWWQEWGIK